jgi:heme A synthase
MGIEMSLSNPTFVAILLLLVAVLSGVFVWAKRRSGSALPFSAVFELALASMSLFIGIAIAVMAGKSMEAAADLLSSNRVFVVVLLLFVGLFAMSRIIRIVDNQDRTKILKREA